MSDVADGAVDDRAGFALALAGLGGDAAHVRHAGDAVDHEDVARESKVVRFELRHAVDVEARAVS